MITRRRLLGTAGGAIGLAACKPANVGDGVSRYNGEVAFKHGIASGDPGATSMILWTRITPLTGAGTIPVRYEIFRESDDTPVLAGMAEANESRDFCVKVAADGLEPATKYRYVFGALTEGGDVVSPEGRTRTLAAEGSDPVRLGVVSCSNWQFGLFTAYAALANEPNLDAIVHLGDYLYEYGIDGYGGDVGTEIGRTHEPVSEITTLAAYRQRHAQYKTDPHLQAAHAVAPWICTWDDHESANDAYRTGAENHNPENGEGDWSDRKVAAMQAYFDWMPIRDPAPGKVREAAWRSFNFGKVARICALETRLTGRSPSIGWFEVLAGARDDADLSKRATDTMTLVADPARTMLGQEQEMWLANQFNSASSDGIAWSVLANQVIMARTKLPNMMEALSPEQLAAQTREEVKLMAGFSAFELPMNLDAWDGYPAARDRLYEAAASANVRLVTLSGDTHTAWANTLVDGRGRRRGVEFGCTSITSPGTGAYVKDVPEFGTLISYANPEVDWHDPFGHGYTIVTLTPDRVEAAFLKVSTILDENYEVAEVARFESRASHGGLTALTKVDPESD